MVQPVRGVWVMTDDQFDQWVFGGPRNSRAGRNKLDSLLTLQVDDVARVCRLSEPQKKKLLLAGRGDIKRFFEKVEEKRKKFDKVKTDQNKIGEIYQELVPLQAVLNSGLFNEGSFYSKTLKTVLSDEEKAKVPGARPREEAVPLSRQGRAGRRPARPDRRLSRRPAAEAHRADPQRDPAARAVWSVRLLPRAVPGRERSPRPSSSRFSKTGSGPFCNVSSTREEAWSSSSAARVCSPPGMTAESPAGS